MKKIWGAPPEREEKTNEPKTRSSKKKIFDTLNKEQRRHQEKWSFFSRGNASEEKERETLHCALLKREKAFEEKKREPRASTLSLSLSLSFTSREKTEKNQRTKMEEEKISCIGCKRLFLHSGILRHLSSESAKDCKAFYTDEALESLTEPRWPLPPRGTQWFLQIGLFVVRAISLGPCRRPIEYLTS